jgi:hypothetical protein
MTTRGFLDLLAELKVEPSHSRPRVSNDNPFSESSINRTSPVASAMSSRGERGAPSSLTGTTATISIPGLPCSRLPMCSTDGSRSFWCCARQHSMRPTPHIPSASCVGGPSPLAPRAGRYQPNGLRAGSAHGQYPARRASRHPRPTRDPGNDNLVSDRPCLKAIDTFREGIPGLTKPSRPVTDILPRCLRIPPQSCRKSSIRKRMER